MDSANVLPPQLSSRPTLVVDLDHTLLDALKVPGKKSECFEENYIVELRPGVREFLERMSQLYEIVLFTAAKKDYADHLVDHYLDKQGSFFSHRLYKDSCHKKKGQKKIKDLSKLGRDLRHVVLLDDKSTNFRRQPDNGIEVVRFERYMSTSDTELQFLENVLVQLANAEDVRPLIKGVYGSGSSKSRKAPSPPCGGLKIKIIFQGRPVDPPKSKTKHLTSVGIKRKPEDELSMFMPKIARTLAC